MYFLCVDALNGGNTESKQLNENIKLLCVDHLTSCKAESCQEIHREYILNCKAAQCNLFCSKFSQTKSI